MFVPVWAIVAIAALIVMLLVWALSRSTAGDDMISMQRRATPPPGPTVADEHAVMTRPEVIDALQRGRKVEAIKHIRAATGLGLKEAKELVDRHAAR